MVARVPRRLSASVRRGSVAAALVIGLGSLPPAGRAFAASTAGDVCDPSADPCVVSSAVAVSDGAVLDFGARAVVIAPRGTLDAGGGSFTLNAGSLTIEPGGHILSRGDSARGGNVTVVTTGDIDVQAAGTSKGRIDVSADLFAGGIDLRAGGAVTVGGLLLAKGRTSDADGGDVSLAAGGLLRVNGKILADAGGSGGEGGSLELRAGGDLEVTGQLSVNGGEFDGGDVELAAGGALTLSGRILASGGGDAGEGGSVSIAAAGQVDLAGEITVRGAGGVDSGGDGGSISAASALDGLVVSGALTADGAVPDGSGGDVTLTATADLDLLGTLSVRGRGGESGGGLVVLQAGRRLQLAATIDARGGTDDGGVITGNAAGTVSVTAPVLADGSGPSGGGGAISLVAGGDVSIEATLGARGADGLGGLVEVAGCDVTVGVPGSLETVGEGGRNTLTARERLTIAGNLAAGTSGTNRLVYRDPGRPPDVLPGAVIDPPAVTAVDPTLQPCVVTPACSNGVLEPPEECDDGNIVGGDGCSPTCVLEVCGNGVLDPAEECDDGNVVPGDGCSDTCVREVGTELVPGGGWRRKDCRAEWLIEGTDGGRNRSGLPSIKRSCMDGDPSCDADGRKSGACHFRLAVCFNDNDPRLPQCVPDAVARYDLGRPNAVAPRDAVEAANAAAVVAAVSAAGPAVLRRRRVLADGPGTAEPDRCTAMFEIEVPLVAGSAAARRLKARARDPANSVVDTDRLVLTCLPNPAVCGDGTVEVGEQCDDGNTAAGDGCSPECTHEICGNGILDFGEQCDDGNTAADDGCSPSCAEEAPAERIPGGGSSRTDCIAEWAVANPRNPPGRRGLPDKKQACRDNDPSCDFDPAAGNCLFHVWLCLGGADPNLPRCSAVGVTSYSVRRPDERRAARRPAEARVRADLLDAVAALQLPISAPACTRRVDVAVPLRPSRSGYRRNKLALKGMARAVTGRKDGDGLRLICIP